MEVDMRSLLQRHGQDVGFSNDFEKSGWDNSNDNTDHTILIDSFDKQNDILFNGMDDILENSGTAFKDLDNQSENVNVGGDDPCEEIDIDIDFLGEAHMSDSQGYSISNLTGNVIEISDDSRESNGVLFYQQDVKERADLFLFAQNKNPDNAAELEQPNAPSLQTNVINTIVDSGVHEADGKRLIEEDKPTNNRENMKTNDIPKNRMSPQFAKRHLPDTKPGDDDKRSQRQFPKLYMVLKDEKKISTIQAKSSETCSTKLTFQNLTDSKSAKFPNLLDALSPSKEFEADIYILDSPDKDCVKEKQDRILESLESLPSESAERTLTNSSFHITLFSADNTRKSKGDNKEDINTEEKMEEPRTTSSEELTKQSLKSKNHVTQKTKQLLKNKIKNEELQVLPKEHFTNKVGFVKDEAVSLLNDSSLSAPILPVGLYKDGGNSPEEGQDDLVDISKPCSCNICGRVFLKYSNLEIHIRGHLGDHPYHCKECDSTFKHNSALKRHMRTHTGERPYRCPVCDKSFIDGTRLRKHILSHNSAKSEFCKICKKGFASRSNLKHHMLTHLDERPFKCEYCNKGFNKNSNLKSHLKIHLGYKPWVCDVCGKEFPEKNRLKMHEKIHWEDKPYKCEQCGGQFAQISNLYVHQRKHRGDKPWKCGQCDKCFMMRSHLTEHVKRHTGEKQFKCAMCQKEYYCKGDFNRHMRTHTGERNHVCETCEERFIDSSTLRIHIRKVHKKHRYRCKFCDKEFSFESSLKRHEDNHMGVKKHFCTLCEAGFLFRVELKDHMNKHVGNKPHSCDICGKSFYKGSELNQHKKIHTGEAMIYCECCNKTFNYKQSYTKHCQSARHARNLRKNDAKSVLDKKSTGGTTEVDIVTSSDETVVSKVREDNSVQEAI